MVSTPVIHVVAWITAYLPTPKGWKAELAWLVDPSDALTVPLTRLSTVGDRAFPVVAARVWNGLPSFVTSSPSLATFKRNLKTELFARSFPVR